jgi:glycosyltransferase involved in cell wall biosynthesis
MRLPEKILPPYWIGENKLDAHLRPFFGWIGRHANGPGNRTKRMTEAFGNYYLNPNLVYAQSAWSGPQIDHTIARAVRRHVPVILNQNGWYYPAWYAGDCKVANRQLLNAHNQASRVIFQSHFCIEAMAALTGVVPNDPLVLHNAVSVLETEPVKRNPARPILWLSGAFHKDADHILLPALKAMAILAQEWKDDLPLLKIAGHFDEAAQKSEWFEKVRHRLDDLSRRKICTWHGKYSPDELPVMMQDVALALHLTSKDACPNAVLERMALGVGHIYANSGGTPELVGDAGIGVNSPLDWNKQTPVDVDELVDAIKRGISQWSDLGRMSFARVRDRFSWESYIESHEQVFARVHLGD